MEHFQGMALEKFKSMEHFQAMALEKFRAMDQFQVETMEQFRLLRGDINDVRQDVRDVRSELKGDIQHLRGEIQELRTEARSDHSKLDELCRSRNTVKIRFGLEWMVASFLIAIVASSVAVVITQ